MFTGEEGKPVIQLLAFFGVLVAILLFGTASIPLLNKDEKTNKKEFTKNKKRLLSRVQTFLY